jgi:hypothetical protein
MTVVLALALAGSGIALVHANAVVDPVLVSESVPVAPPTLEAALLDQAPALDPSVLGLALRSHANASRRGLLQNRDILTVIDYSRPSIEPRVWVFDLAARKLLWQERVAHGKNSGQLFSTHFSNVESSLESSLGLFVTRDEYTGQHGTSLRLDGLEPGVNDLALKRAIVIHGADYVSNNAVVALGFLGRSWGCPALSRDVAPQVIQRLQGGSAVFAFYPDMQWLATSQFLRPEPAPTTLLGNAGL